MAFTTTAVSPATGILSVYNVDFGVGSGAPNHKDDVMLVQALMRIYYWELTAGLNGGFSPPALEKEPIAVDGFAGPSTRRHILKFQQDQRGVKKAIVAVDGRLDPFRKQLQFSTISKTQYGLEVLNFECFHHCRINGVNNHQDLPNREDVPPELRAALKTVKTTAAAYQTSFG